MAKKLDSTPQKLLSIVIVSYNTKDILRNCLNYVREYAQDFSHEVYVVDNDSHDHSADMVAEEFPEVHLIRSPKNVGFAAGNNLALRKCVGRYLLLLNSDAYLFEDTLPKTLKYMDENPKTGILGVKLVGEDGEMQPSARMLPTPWLKFLVISGIASKYPNSPKYGGPDYTWWDHSEPKNVGWVPGAYFLVRKEVTERIGFLDERYFLYFEEIDFCLRTKRAHWEVTFYPYTKCIHLGGQSSAKSSELTQKAMTSGGKQLLHLRIKNELRYYRKNHGFMPMIKTAFVEIFWKGMIYLKNSIRRKGEESRMKREEAKLVIKTFLNCLKEDKYGTVTTN